MGPTHARLTFRIGRKVITVYQTSDRRFSLKVTGPGWRLKKKNLTENTVSKLIILIAASKRRLLTRSIKGLPNFRIGMHLEGAAGKAIGVNWMALRAAAGTRAILLKAPSLFGNSFIHIEPTSEEDTYLMRIVSIESDRISEPVAVSGRVVDSAVAALSNNHHGNATTHEEHRERMG